DGQAEVDVLGRDQGRLAVDLGEVVVHLRVVAERLDHRVADHVGEADLAAARALEVVVDHYAVVGQQLGRHGAHAGRGGHRQRGLHVRDDPRGGPAQGARLIGGRRALRLDRCGGRGGRLGGGRRGGRRGGGSGRRSRSGRGAGGRSGGRRRLGRCRS